MSDYNVRQYAKFNSRKSFVEVNEAFGIGKIRVGFRQYDESRDAGSRVTVQIDYYLNDKEARKIARLILDKAFIRKVDDRTLLLSAVQNSRMNWIDAGKPEKGYFYQSPPGGKIDEANPANSVYRVMKILPANSGDYRLAAYTGHGVKDAKGLIHLDGKITGYVFVPISEEDLFAFAEALRDAADELQRFRYEEWNSKKQEVR